MHLSCGRADVERAAGSCFIADELLGLDGLHLLVLDRLDADVKHPRGLLRRHVIAAGHGRREHRLTDAPCFGTPVKLIWRKRRWRCREPRYPAGVWSEKHPALPAWAKLSTRAVDWAIQT